MKVVKEVATFSKVNDFNLSHMEEHKRYVMENDFGETFGFTCASSEDPVKYLESLKYLEKLDSTELKNEAFKLIVDHEKHAVSYIEQMTAQRRCNEISLIWNRNELRKQYSAEELDRNVIVHTYLEGNEQYTTTTMRMQFIDYLNLPKSLMKREMEEVA